MSFKKNLLLAIAIVFLSSSVWFYNKVEESNKIPHNIAYVHALQSFILATQKTRGLTNSYRHGNISALLLVYGEREQIANSVAIMHKLNKNDILNSEIVRQQEALAKKAILIHSTALKEEPMNVFKNYTSLINDSIVLSNEHEKVISSLDPHYHSISYLYFPLIEAIAKLRGLGSGSAAKKICSDDEATKLTTFIQEIQKLRTKIPLTPQSKYFLETVEDYTTLATRQIIKKSSLNIDPDVYFDQGTAVITAITTYTDTLQKKQNDLALDTYKKALYTTWILFLFSIISLILYLRVYKKRL